MKIQTSLFVSSNTTYKNCPNTAKPEFAFIGRSNVGKSSLINTLLQRKQLAKVSKTPGKTQLINHFLVNNKIYFVDLPGYGWAQVAHAQKIKWKKMVHNYLLHREQLVVVFLLIDSKIPPQAIDLSFIDWLKEHQVYFAIIFTKTDRKDKIKSQKHYTALVRLLEKNGATIPDIFFASAHDKLGIEDILSYIQALAAKNS
ncbi:MAG: ribosome biogenesis GTP-binding protein YihA/YsxC [Amoebophilaceae bacterium]|nr:ribosome biogenesis GTP-binding protein YihA/YsxC [Amoebophilaceae bacterium]